MYTKEKLKELEAELASMSTSNIYWAIDFIQKSVRLEYRECITQFNILANKELISRVEK